MSDVRNGKIARLPSDIREKLNRRLRDGEPGTRLVDWLNGLPEVRKVLKDQFGGRPVSGQNLSEWKQGGHQDWLRHQDVLSFVRRLREKTAELRLAAGDFSYEAFENEDKEDVSEYLAVVLGAELARAACDLLKETDNPPERWRRLREVLHENNQLRRHNHRATRLKWDQRRWEREEDLLDEKERRREFEEKKNKILKPLLLRTTGELNTWTEILGGGEAARKIAAFILEVRNDLPMGSLSDGQESNPVKPGQTESGPIKPDQTGSNQKQPPAKPPVTA